MDVKELKLEMLRNFDKLIHRMSYGHHDNYSRVLNLISFIHSWNEIDNVAPLYEYFLNDTK